MKILSKQLSYQIYVAARSVAGVNRFKITRNFMKLIRETGAVLFSMLMICSQSAVGPVKFLLLGLLLSLPSFARAQTVEAAHVCTSEKEIVDGQLVLTDVDKPPVYAKGRAAFYEMLYKEMKLSAVPEHLTVYVSFIVDVKGNLRSICIMRPYYEDRISSLEAEVLRVFSKLDGWSPGEHEGKQVPVRMIFPIRFRPQK